MWMMSASTPLLSLQRAALGSLCLLCACLRVRIWIFCRVLPLWCFLTHLMPRPASHWVVLAPRCFVASCAFTGIVSQGLARPCSVDLSVSPQTEAKPWWGLPMDAKNEFFRPRFVRKRSTGLPLLMLNTQCSPAWVR